MNTMRTKNEMNPSDLRGLKHWGVLATVLGTLLVAGCSDFDNGYSKEDILYKETYTDKFGNIDSNQDWNAATRATVNVDLTGITDSEADVLVFNANPFSGGELAAAYQVTGSASFMVDLPKTAPGAYVSVVDADGQTRYSRYVEAVDGQVNVSQTSTRSRADEACTTTIGRVVPMEGTFGKYGTDWSTSNTFNFNCYYLNNVRVTPGGAWTVKDMTRIVGEGGTYYVGGYQTKFPEGYFAEGRNNREYYKDKLSKDVILDITSPTTVNVGNLFGGTAFTNQFGYYYYRDGATPEQTLQNKLKAPKIVIMDNAEPQNNITIDGKEFTDGMLLPQVVSSYYNGWQPTGFDHTVTGNEMVKGQSYDLVYFGENFSNDEASFTFPAGTHIGFFVRRLANYYPLDESTYADCEKMGNNYLYSDSELNHYYGLVDSETGTGEWKSVTTPLSCTVVTTKDGVTRTVNTSVTLVGFEDGYDNDMNDLLYVINGINTHDEEILFSNNVNGQTWFVGCEDLGAIGDFDFNDVVFGIQHVAGETKATIYPMAAGGTLPVYLFNATNGEPLYDGEFHTLWGSERTYDQIINADMYTGMGTPIEFDVPEDYTVANVSGSTNMGGIEIHVAQNGSAGTTSSAVNIINAPQVGAVPQMILIHQFPWAWPKEAVSITEAYPDFLSWSQTNSPSNWYESSVTYEKTVFSNVTISDSNGVITNPSSTGQNAAQPDNSDNNNSGSGNGSNGGSSDSGNTGNNGDNSGGSSDTGNTGSTTPQATKTVTYSGAALQALYDPATNTYSLPSELFAGVDDAAIDFGYDSDGGWNFGLSAWSDASGIMSWQSICPFEELSSVYDQYRPAVFPGQTFDTAFTVRNEYLEYVGLYGINIVMYDGRITQIEVVTHSSSASAKARKARTRK